MEGETTKEERKEEEPIEKEKEKDNLPNEGIIDKKVTKEAPGLRRRVNVQTKNEPAPLQATVTHEELQRLLAPNGKYVAVSDGKGNYKLVPRPVHKVSLWFPRTLALPQWSIQANINVWYWVMVVVAFTLRFWRIDWPKYVIFDEVHFGKFASYYLTRTFFFDVHPPLGKLIFALIGYWNGFDGSFLFTTIGEEYPSDVPYVLMRGASALCGALLIPTIYEIMIELGFTHRGALLACFFTLLDNSLQIQSRVIMLDSFVVLFSYLSILGYLKVYHCRSKTYTKKWHLWLLFTGISLSLVLGVKYTGLLALGCVGLIALVDIWQIVGDLAVDKWPEPNPSLRHDLIELFTHMGYRGLYLLGIPILMNIILFYIHFAILTQSGPGNGFVSLPFQDTLLGTPPNSTTSRTIMNISANATLLRYSSHVTLRNLDNNCWLHSHKDLYPLKYPDGRGSSYQQQVTCYEFKDVNNYWTIRRPGEANDTAIPNDTSPVKNKDIVEFVHVRTQKLLNSHDVAAPLTPANQEIAGYINYSTKFVPYLQWRLEIEGVADESPIFWNPGKIKLKLFHKQSGQVMSCSGIRLPEWGFRQFEVYTDKVTDVSSAKWSIFDVQGPNVTDDMINEEAELRNATINSIEKRRRSRRNTNDTSPYSFLEKYFEMQGRMLAAHGNLGDHQFGATPIKWPLLGKTLPYWLHHNTNAQITLIGNPLLWWTGTCSIILFFVLLLFYILRRRRCVYDLPNDVFEQWLTSGLFLTIGWMAHYLPYFFISRVLFLHHYLPALPFKFMVLAAMCEHGFAWVNRFKWYPKLVKLVYQLFISILCVCVLVSFIVYAPFTFGYPSLSKPTIQWLAVVNTWDLLMRN